MTDGRPSPEVAKKRTSPTRALLPCAVTALLLTTNATFAAQPNCSNATDQATLNQCANTNLKASDAKLNQTFRALLAKVSKPGKDKLQKAQRAWITWRDAQCDFNTSGSRDGSAFTQWSRRAVSTNSHKRKRSCSSTARKATPRAATNSARGHVKPYQSATARSPPPASAAAFRARNPPE
jgi:uncharacterized protein YecT (DUF1311 family)